MHELTGKQLEAFQMVMSRMERLERENQELMQILLQMQGLLQQQQQRNVRLSQIASKPNGGADVALAAQATARQTSQVSLRPPVIPGGPPSQFAAPAVAPVPHSGQRQMQAAAMLRMPAPATAAPPRQQVHGVPLQVATAPPQSLTTPATPAPASSGVARGEKRRAPPPTGGPPGAFAPPTPGGCQTPVTPATLGTTPPAGLGPVAPAAMAPVTPWAGEGDDQDGEEAPWKCQRRRPRRTRADDGDAGGEGDAAGSTGASVAGESSRGLAAYHNALLGV